MTDTIEAHRQRAAEASLFQQRPAWLIDAGQGREVTDPYRYATPYYGGSHAIDFHVIWANIAGTVAVFTGLTRTVLPDIVATVPAFTGLTGTVRPAGYTGPRPPTSRSASKFGKIRGQDRAQARGYVWNGSLRFRLRLDCRSRRSLTS